MENQEDLFEPSQDKARISAPLLLFMLSGMGLTVAFILFSFSDQLANTSNISPTTGAAMRDTVIVTMVPLVDPRVGSVNGAKQAKVGQLAPNFTLQSLDGTDISLSDYIGRPVLINFWATWCAPCRREMPELVKAYNEHENEGFVILAVDLAHQDDIDAVQAFVEEFEMTFPVLLDETGEVSDELYNLIGLPMSVFINREGRIVHIYVGLMLPDQIDEFVNEILE